MQKKAVVEEWDKAYVIGVIDENTLRKQGLSLYVVKVGDFYKIGYASNIGARLTSLQTGSPQKLELILVAYCGEGAKDLEKKYHEQFASRHHRGEWFSLTREDLLEIVQDIQTTWQRELL